MSTKDFEPKRGDYVAVSVVCGVFAELPSEQGQDFAEMAATCAISILRKLRGDDYARGYLEGLIEGMDQARNPLDDGSTH